MVFPVLKLCLDEIELDKHPFLRRNAPDVEGSAAREVSTEMREPQKREGLRFSLTTPLSVSDRRTARTRSDVSCPDAIPDRTLPAVPETPQGTARRRLDFESPHRIVGIRDDDNIAACDFLAPSLSGEGKFWLSAEKTGELLSPVYRLSR
jgi:hypothetical protein